MLYEPDNHYDNSNKKHENGDSVHSMHHFYIDISGFVGVAFADIEIS